MGDEKKLCKECRMDGDVVRCTLNELGKHHSFDGLPAVIRTRGSTCWYKNGHLHREDGPAVEWDEDDDDYWYLNGISPFMTLKKKLYVGKIINIIYIHKEPIIGLVTKKINDCWYEVLIGDEKKFVVSLDKYKEG